MCKLLPALLTLLCMTAPACAAPLEPDQYAQIVLGTAGASVSLDVRTSQEGYLVSSPMLPPPELGTLHVTATNARGAAVDIKGAKSLPAGIYHLRVTADGASPEPFNYGVRFVSWKDRFEPNDTARTAAKIELPFNEAIALRDSGDQDWFSFDLNGPGVLLVRLTSPAARSELLVEANAQNDPELRQGAKPATGDDASKITKFGNGAGVARRYFEVTARGAWLVMAKLGADPAADGSEMSARMDIVFYPDKPSRDMTPALVALGTSDTDPAIEQMRLRLRAEGRTVLVTNDPNEIARALTAVALAPIPGARWPVWLWLVIGLGILGGAGGVAVWRYPGMFAAMQRAIAGWRRSE